MKLFISILFFQYLLILSIVGQINLDFDQLSIDDGLTSSRANAIIQDRNGFIWIGTWNGLNRYDGNKCVVYQPQYRDSTWLRNREITALLEDKNGLIWIGTTSGLSSLDPRTNTFTHLPISHPITCLFEDRQENFWIGTTKGGLLYLNRETNELINYLGGEIVNAIYEDSRNEFWLATFKGLINFDRYTKHYQRYLKNENPQTTIRPTRFTPLSGIAESKKGDLWVTSNTNGLFKIEVPKDKEQLKAIHYASLSTTQSFSDGLAMLTFDKYNNLWLGTSGNGILFLSNNEQLKQPENAYFQSYRNNINDPFSLKGNDYITSLFIDQIGTLWVGSSVINKTNISSNGIQRYNTQFINDGKVLNDWVNDINSDNNGNFWVSTSDGIIQFNLKNHQQIQHAFLSKWDLKNETFRQPTNVQNSELDSYNRLWISTDNSGIIILNNSDLSKHQPNKSIVANVHTTPSISSNFVNQIVKSNHYPNTMWVGTANNGMIKCEYEDKSIKNITTYKEGRGSKSLTDKAVRVIYEDSKGDVWIGTQNGLNCLKKETNTIDQYYYSLTNQNSINDNIINTIHEDSDGNLWIGSNSGINKVIENKDSLSKTSFKAYPNHKSLSSSVVLNILEDDHKNIWVGVYNGVIKFSIVDENLVDEYYLKEYSRVKIGRLTSWKDNNGFFFFGGGNGFLSFHPDSIANSNLEPQIQITDFKLYNKSVNTGEVIHNNIILNQEIAYTKSLTLSFYDKVFSISFALLDYNSPDQNQYAYLLEGFDKEWNYVNESTSATYTDIPSGNYTFKVKGCNSSGNWTNNIRSLNIEITPPWWKSNYAYIIYGIVLLALIYLFQRIITLKIKEKNRHTLRKVSIAKQHELNNLKLQFFTNITHELRTPLSLIVAPLEEMMEHKSNFGKYGRSIELIKNNANRLLRLVNQIMEFRKVENEKMDLHLQKTDITQALSELHESFRAMAHLKDITFQFYHSSTPITADVDKEKLDRIMFNLLSNAFKFTKDGGEIKVEVSNDESESNYYIKVIDSGIGIHEKDREKIFERFYQVNETNEGGTGGIGLYLTKAYIELHGGEISVTKNQPTGSCFIIMMPKKIATVNGEEQKQSLDSIVEENTFTDNSTKDDLKSYILIAEDDIEMNEYLLSSLSESHNVQSVFNGLDAYEMAQQSSPDLIIMDIMMPKMNGLEACKKLKQDVNTSHVPILFLTAKTNMDSEIEGLKYGAIDYITKPFSLMSLKLKVQNILDQQDALRLKYRQAEIMKPEAINLPSIDEKFLADAVAVVDNNLSNPELDVNLLSLEIGLSSNQTYRKIKALTGQTAKEFIRLQRLKVAANLLQQNKRNISEIVYMVGFSTPSYFTRCFKEFYGCSPKEYAAKNRLK